MVAVSPTNVSETAESSSLNKPYKVVESLPGSFPYEETTYASTEDAKSGTPHFADRSAGTPSTNAGDTPSGKDLVTNFDLPDPSGGSKPVPASRPESPLKNGETMLSLTRGRPRPRLTSPTLIDGRRPSLLFGQISPPAIPHPGDVGGSHPSRSSTTSSSSTSPSPSSSSSPTKSPPPFLHDLNNDRTSASSCGKNKTVPSPTGSESLSTVVEFPVFFSFQQIVGSMMKSVTEGERLGPGRGVTLQDFFEAAEAVGHVMASSMPGPPQRVNSAGACSTSGSRGCSRRGSLSRSAYLGVRPPISPDGQRRASWVGGTRNRSYTEYNRSRCFSASSSAADFPGDDEDGQLFPLGRTRSFTGGTTSLGSRNPSLFSKPVPPRRRVPGALQRLTDSVANGNMRLIVTDDLNGDEVADPTAEVSTTSKSPVIASEANNGESNGCAAATVSGSPAKSESFPRPRRGSLIEPGSSSSSRPRRNSRAACFIEAHTPLPETLASADVDFGNLIGSGSFGDVFKAKCKQTGEFIAVKVVSYEDGDKASEVAAKQLANEMDILQQLEHPNIIRYIGHEFIPPNVEWDPLPRDPAMHQRLLQHRCTMGRLLVFTEYMSGGSVKSALSDFGSFEEPQIASYSVQILSGLEYLHKRSVSHRDLKCDNLLLDAYGTVKLGDFGSSRQIGSSVVMTQLSGSIPWMAPEVISAGDSKGYSISADIWSFGIVVIEMATGTHPWVIFEVVVGFGTSVSEDTMPTGDYCEEMCTQTAGCDQSYCKDNGLCFGLYHKGESKCYQPGSDATDCDDSVLEPVQCAEYPVTTCEGVCNGIDGCKDS
ncbi:hypothetical protein FOZ61_010272, partial [Perkinsus olseni]